MRLAAADRWAWIVGGEGSEFDEPVLRGCGSKPENIDALAESSEEADGARAWICRCGGGESKDRRRCENRADGK
ncbi:MAG: hypothetical protein LBS84_07560 [Clostridiales bacterium]|nr:hypothetical protein [Clostridiales bacterium]